MSGHRFLRASLVGTLVFVAQIVRADGDFTTQPTTLTVPENADRGALVGALDPESVGPDCRFSIVTGNHNEAFSIDDRNGRLTVNNATALNHETRQRFDLILNVERPATDDPALRAFLGDVIDSGASLEAVEELLTDIEELRLTILVEDVPERPLLPVQSTTIMVFGNEPVEEGWIDVHDEDRDESLNFEILAGAPTGLFRIDRDTGRIWIDQPAEFAPGDHEFPLTVQVTDSAGFSDATTIALRVIALPGAPSSLVVAAPPIPPGVPSESNPSTASIDHTGDPADDSTGPTGTDAEPPAESIAVSVPAIPQSDDAGDEPPVRTDTPPLTDGDALGDMSIVSRVLRIGGIFILLGIVVAVVMAWLKWRAVNDAADSADDHERLLRLQSILEDPDTTGVDDVQPLTGTSALEDRVMGQLTDLQHMLAAPTDASQDCAGDEAHDAIEHPGDSDLQGASDVTGARSEAPPECHEIAQDETTPEESAQEELFEISQNDYYEVESDEQQAAGTQDVPPDSHQSESATDESTSQASDTTAADHRLADPDVAGTPPLDSGPITSTDSQVESVAGTDEDPDAGSASDSVVGDSDTTAADHRLADPDVPGTPPLDSGPITSAGSQVESVAGTDEDPDAGSASDSVVGDSDASAADHRLADPYVPGTPPLDSGPITSAGSQVESVTGTDEDPDAGIVSDSVVGDSDIGEVAVDSRISLLRDELIEKFGIALPDSTGESESPTAESKPHRPAASEEKVESDSVGAGSLIDAGTTLETALNPVDESRSGHLGTTESPAAETESSPLMTARFMTQRTSEPPAESGADREQTSEPAPAVKEQHSVTRSNKSAMRRELSSLRMVANRHARAVVAKHATRKRTRQTWYKSASLMVLLNFAAMGLLASSPVGVLKVIGWGLMLAAAAALAVCLHSFRRMVASQEAEKNSNEESGVDVGEEANSGIEESQPETVAIQPTTGLPAPTLPASQGMSALQNSEDSGGDTTTDHCQTYQAASDLTVATHE